MTVATNLDHLWATWKPTETKPDSDVKQDMDNLSLNKGYVHHQISCSMRRELTSRMDAKTKSSEFETSARKNKLEMYKEIISIYHKETNNRMYNKRWEELHDPALVKISLEQRLEQGSKGKDAANA
jgi:hypothetical protein